jgi:UDP-N-acetyl-D-glucosamine dehydrogenase
VSEAPILRAAELKVKIERTSAVVGVVGLGVVGSLSARLFAAAGFRCIGVDRSVERIEQERDTLSGVELTTDMSALAQADIVMIAVRAGGSKDGADVSAVRSAFDSLKQQVKHPVLLLLESTVPPGTTRSLAEGCFGAKSPQAQLTCHCPERLRVGDDIEAIRGTPRLVGGITKVGAQLGVQFLAKAGITGVDASAPEVTELAKLLENCFLTTGIALMGEITRIAHALGVSAQEVARAAATKPHGYFPFQPGAGIGGHCLINDLTMLRVAAKSLGIDSELLTGVDSAAARLNTTLMRRLEQLLHARDIPMREAVVCIVGVGFKAGSSDTSQSPAADITRQLLLRGASVAYTDSLVPRFVVDGQAITRVTTPLALERADAVLLLSGDQKVNVDAVLDRIPVVLDAGGGRFTRGQAHRASVL